jgi:hypothetical protein
LSTIMPPFRMSSVPFTHSLPDKRERYIRRTSTPYNAASIIDGAAKFPIRCSADQDKASEHEMGALKLTAPLLSHPSQGLCSSDSDMTDTNEESLQSRLNPPNTCSKPSSLSLL